VTVAITGIGIASPLGFGHEPFWQALCEGRSGVRAIDDAYRRDGVPSLGAPLSEPPGKRRAASPKLRRADTLSRTIAGAAREALADAGFDPADMALARLGLVVGSAYGNLHESAVHLQRLFTRGAPAVSPLLFPNLVVNAPAAYAAMELSAGSEAMGTNLTISQLEISGECAVIAGADLVRSGQADVVVAGGGDEISEILVEVYRRAGALSGQAGGEEWSSPYDRARTGVVLGEGSAMLVLETAKRARTRGRTIYAEIESDVLFSVESPPYEIPTRPGAAADRIRAEFGAATDGVDLVCGAANSSLRFDRLELELLADLLGEHARHAWLTSIKGATGEHGSAGALTIAAAALALWAQAVPPLCNLREPEHGALFRFAGRTATAAQLKSALVAGIARGGAGAALLLRRAGSGPCSA